ncbi:phosphotransferase [Exiguobacterium artemiae]|uniref:phosphotransferase n=1 Tax=Exiguobacterium artemiae TaxID=340145 RepID=UPI002E1546C3
MQHIETHYYLVFRWVDAVMLTTHQITADHAAKIGKQLAHIHSADLSSLQIQQPPESSESGVSWDEFVEHIRLQGLTALDPVTTNLRQIKRWADVSSVAMEQLTGTVVLSHRDLDAKNVLWKSGLPVLIDWESAGYIHPMHDFVETALYWSLDENNQLHDLHFEAFAKEYVSTGAKLHFPIEPALSAGYAGKLEWLAYSLSKALRLEPVDDQEQQVAVQQVLETLTALKDYEVLCPLIEERWIDLTMDLDID